MAFKEVTKTPNRSEINQLKREYKALQKKYDNLKYQFQDALRANDFKSMSVDKFLELKELHIEKKQLYWKIYSLENPEDTATPKAYQFLNTMPMTKQLDFLANNGLTTHKLIQELEKNPNFLDEVTV